MNRSSPFAPANPGAADDSGRTVYRLDQWVSRGESATTGAAADSGRPPDSGGRRRAFVAVSYDIVDDRRRARVCKTLKAYGVHVQDSVFECYLTAEAVERLRRRLAGLIASGEDQVRYYVLCQSCQAKVLVDGRGAPTTWEPFKIV
jgi:CRISPR-associated protein Cas2